MNNFLVWKSKTLTNKTLSHKLDKLDDKIEVEELDLSENSLESFPNLSERKQFRKARKIDLSRNKLSKTLGHYIPEGIKEVYLNYNSLTSLADFRHLAKLEILDASHNELTTLPDLHELRCLRVLRLEWNNINNIPAEYFPINAEEAILHHNQIDELSNISDLKCLKRLDISYNQILDFPADHFPSNVDVNRKYQGKVLSRNFHSGQPSQKHLASNTAIYGHSESDDKTRKCKSIRKRQSPKKLPQEDIISKSSEETKRAINSKSSHENSAWIEDLPKQKPDQLDACTSKTYESENLEKSKITMMPTMGGWKIPFQSGIYNLKKADMLVSIPDIPGPASGDLYITIGPVQDVEGVCDSDDLLSDMITLLPHRSTFQNHIMVVFPIKPTKVNSKDIQLMFSDSDDGEKMRWVNLQQNNTRVKHTDSFFWFIRDHRCFLFMRHFSHVFMTATSKLKKQDAIYATVSLHGLFRKQKNEKRYQLEFAIGFHCHECFPKRLQYDNIQGVTLDSEKQLFFGEEGPITATVDMDIKGENWIHMSGNSRRFAPRIIINLCHMKDIHTFRCKFYSKGLEGIDTTQVLTGTASVEQNGETLPFNVNTTLDIIKQELEKGAASNTNTSDQHDNGTKNDQQEYSNVESNIEEGSPQNDSDSDCDSGTYEICPEEHMETEGNTTAISSHCNSFESTRFQQRPTVIQNMTQVNQYFIAPLPSHLSNLQGLPLVHKEGECIFNPSLYHEQTHLCELMDKVYEDKLEDIVDEMKEIKGTVDMKNINALVILQVWALHVKSKDCTWRLFYDLLLKYDCKDAAQQLKVLYEKDRLLNKLDILKHQLVMRDVVGQLVSKGVITLIEKDKLRQMHDSESVEHLVQDLLMKRPHDCILNFHRVLYCNRYFEQYIKELMLCPEDITNKT